MKLSPRSTQLTLVALSLIILSGCASVKTSFKDGVEEAKASFKQAREDTANYFLAAEGGDAPERIFAIPGRDRVDNLLQNHAPVILSESDWSAWNRVGTPSLYRDDNDVIQVRVDPTIATLYGALHTFTGQSGSTYRNLVYRMHFERTPRRYKPLILGAGKNSGLIFITTLNDKDEPVLYTTTHTCGCYTAIVPTSAIARASLPEDWEIDEQRVHQERLPGMLVIPTTDKPADRRVTLTLRDSSHRVARIAYENFRELAKDHIVEPTRLVPMDRLDNLRVEGPGEEVASMFDNEGYVRGSKKPLERALVSWWAFDKRVGQDKRLGTSSDEGTTFYTSLDYRDREASDMRDFARFLQYRGFSL